MARIRGVNIPDNKKLFIALTYIYGIGKYLSNKICSTLSIDPDKRVKDLSETDFVKIGEYLDANCVVEGNLRQKVSTDIKKLLDIGCYKGIRHRLGLPVHGQRTKTNGKTRKGKGRAIANKKIVQK